ncbi:methyltransferase small domain-containing protein [Ditylenchus destructor]|uniref:Methyltransferase-like protein 5 n=1 Tax=Ditylenchus destructor TaxID=166010 RepID=A0AAD4NAH9_9BILA|nr:methyltransferase small domain-containing protein [Ditylenchus destructor]
MKRKQLESFLHQLDTFETPRLELEQYATSAELATSILEAINEDSGLDEGTVLGDLGCGCGVLMLGAAKLGAGFCIGYDIDDAALSICRQNIDDAGLGDICDLVQVDLMSASTSNPLSRFHNSFNIIVTNPPFGTKGNSGTDLKFIELGLSLLKPGGHLYSLHKTATRRVLAMGSDVGHGIFFLECVTYYPSAASRAVVVRTQSCIEAAEGGRDLHEPNPVLIITSGSQRAETQRDSRYIQEPYECVDLWVCGPYWGPRGVKRREDPNTTLGPPATQHF